MPDDPNSGHSGTGCAEEGTAGDPGGGVAGDSRRVGGAAPAPILSVGEGSATEGDLPEEGSGSVADTGDDADSVYSDIFESQVPPADLHLIPLEELREFVEEIRGRRDRAHLALDRWSSFQKVYWSVHAARQAPGLDINERKRVRNFLGTLLVRARVSCAPPSSSQ
ncbi:hypothetical protein chiPu_0027725 [Chiloscyllium punctatum]|uniref:Uncharacterized protein n=1 Tax=Chiloscyllium punctatum TaxID=137246 RepID=A0A401TMJ0_CHIPU|nr:hypothetical protein [Chiloscyllium punctatum]